MPSPATVTDVEPVAATFPTYTPPAVATSLDHASDMLPDPSPTVTDTPRVPSPPCPDPHSTDVSDSHVLRSLALPPIPTDGEEPHTPSPAPATVTLADPVAPPLLRPKPLAALQSALIDAVMLPDCAQTLSATRPACLSSPAVSPATPVSDTHRLPSHAVPDHDSDTE
jgi:hypothetical protein